MVGMMTSLTTMVMERAYRFEIHREATAWRQDAMDIYPYKMHSCSPRLGYIALMPHWPL